MRPLMVSLSAVVVLSFLGGPTLWLSLMSQGIDRIKLRRTPRREKAKNHPDGRRKQK